MSVAAVSQPGSHIPGVVAPSKTAANNRTTEIANTIAEDNAIVVEPAHMSVGS